MIKDYKLMIFGKLSVKSYDKEKANKLYKHYISLFGIENVKFVYLG